MKVGDLVYKTPSPGGRAAFMGIIIAPIKASMYGSKGWKIFTLDGKIEKCFATTLEIINESG
jgi:hypothetical protein